MVTNDPGRGDASKPAQQLDASLKALIQESQALRADVHTAEQARRRANYINLGLLGLLAMFVVLLLVVTWQNNQVVHSVNKTNQTMADCTTPGGVCYQQGSARTSQAIGDIIRAEIFMAQCARLYPGEVGPDYDRKLEACVYARLADRGRGAPTPGPTVSPKTPTPTPSVSTR